MRYLLVPVTLALAVAAPLSPRALAQGAGGSTAAAPQGASSAGEFPPDAQALATEELHQRLVGKTYAYKSAGTTVRLDFRSNGYVYLNTSTGFNSSGRWKVEQSSLCSEIRNAPHGCAEMRRSGERLFLKRLNGEVVEMLPG